jgi:hypothetical protein
MSYTWAQAQLELGRMLGDPTAVTWSDDLRLDAYNHALAAFAAHTAKASGYTVTGDGVMTSITLPDSVVDPSAVFLLDVDADEWWEDLGFSQSVKYELARTRGSDDRTYYEWPERTLQLGRVLENGETVKVHTYFYWDEVSDDADEILVPRWAREALLHYAAAYCMSPSVASAANIGQFDTKLDAGNPEHNPFERRIEGFLRRYRSILDQWTPQTKAPPWTPKR